MRAQQHPLWQKLRRYEFGDLGARERFTARLARDEQWSQPYAERVVDEYLRFMFLGCVGSATVCPSEDVDRVWHQHLTYTREYWGPFCTKVLGKPFHHTPAGPGGDEREKHVAMYRATLAAYESWFDHRPPTDIWPTPERRFPKLERPRAPSAPAAFDEAAYDGVAGRAARWSTIVVTCGIYAAALAAVHRGLTNPLDLPGPEFLGIYVIMLVACVTFGVIVRITQRPPKLVFGETLPQLDGYETAYLTQGTAGVAYASIAALVRRGTLVYSDTSHRLSVGIVPAPWDLIAATTVKSVKANQSCKKIATAMEPHCEPIRKRLIELGLLVPEAVGRRVRRLAVLPLAMLLTLGCAKIGVGLMREKPVSFLVLWSIAALTAGLILHAPWHERSERGERALTSLKHTHRESEKTAFAAESSAVYSTLVTTYGLFGLSALYNTPVGPLRNYLPGNRTGDAGTSGCGGSGGCGGGGCGGGGCGGCS